MTAAPSSTAPDITSDRLTEAEIDARFAKVHPPLDRHEALAEADRCYFC